MCSRFELIIKPADLMERFDVSELPPQFATNEIYPTNNILALDNSGAFTGKWGLKIAWGKNLLINARSETLLKKPTFQPLLTSRCIVPATAYFEWRVTGKTRVKNRIFLSDSEAFALAALTNGNEIIILTCLPLPEIAHIHRRMPIILSQDTEKIWIDRTRATSDLLKITRLNYVLALKFIEENTGPFNQRELF